MHAGWFTLKLVLRKYPVPETGQSLYAWKGTGLTLDMEYSSIFNFCSVTSANLTKVYRMKEFFSSFFSSANIIARAKVNIILSVSILLPFTGRLLIYRHPPQGRENRHPSWRAALIDAPTLTFPRMAQHVLCDILVQKLCVVFRWTR